MMRWSFVAHAADQGALSLRRAGSLVTEALCEISGGFDAGDADRVPALAIAPGLVVLALGVEQRRGLAEQHADNADLVMRTRPRPGVSGPTAAPSMSISETRIEMLVLKDTRCPRYGT
jgi:hypothetical protein